MTQRRTGVAGPLVAYTAARLGLLVVIAGVLVLLRVPLVVAVLIALVVSLSLSLVLFRGLRARLNQAIAESTEHRRAEHARLRASLRGEPGVNPGEPAVNRGEPATDQGDRPVER